MRLSFQENKLMHMHHYMSYFIFSYNLLLLQIEQLRWCRGSVLASDTQVSEFKPGRSRQIFKGR
jgi:hypothetical protein